jgi:hypothetical protein
MYTPSKQLRRADLGRSASFRTVHVLSWRPQSIGNQSRRRLHTSLKKVTHKQGRNAFHAPAMRRQALQGGITPSTKAEAGMVRMISESRNVSSDSESH